MGEQRIFLKTKAIFSLFYAFCDKKSAEKILKVPNIKCLESSGHLWEALYILFHARSTTVFQNISLCKPPISFFHNHPATAEDENRQK